MTKLLAPVGQQPQIGRHVIQVRGRQVRLAQRGSDTPQSRDGVLPTLLSSQASRPEP
ncbi:hypothetical protein K1T35_47345 [Pseudonocardia sp. DSM 110487]|uniref:hypothetical protein n=1 Tax=Pseudonocardia sp. DSM 110487 TaxID=2865833 RepID=UPI001C6A43DD|nr:hypothetical protein [Pseudonocardia sp. DSM 110487]QYN35801.1 hypothetical protein K1T35_47345 [Pseudonocardia sp. DSM 110487]